MRTALATTIAAWLSMLAVVPAQAPTPIWDGVYTAAQAERGSAVYMGACIRCHGADLAGTTAPALKGERFMASFGGESLSRLFEKIRDTMPPNVTNTLDDSQKRDIVAFILQANGYPSGARELPAGNGLAAIHILRKGEQPRVQNFALVRVVGCLAAGEKDAWVLRNSTDAVATTESTPPAEAIPAAAGQPLGKATFVLLSARPFDPASQVGQKVEARGLIYQDAREALLTVTSLTRLGGCE